MENKLVFEPIDAGFVLHNGIVKLRLLRVNGAYTQEYFARAAEGWRLICAAERNTERIEDAGLFRDLVIGRERDGEQAAQFTDVQVAREHPTKITLKLTAQIEQHHIALYITLEAGKNHFHCLIEDDIHEKSLVEYLSAPLVYVPGGAMIPADDLDIIWVPHQRPLDEHVIGDHSFRSPAVILQKENDLAIMVPDVEILSRNRVFRTAVDFEVHGRLLPTPTFAYGFKDWVPDRHVYFSHMLGEGVPIPSDGGFRSSTSRSYLLENTCLRFGYYLYLSAQAEPMTGRRTALNFLWETFARPYMESQWPQVIPFEDYIRYMFGWANRHEDTIWQKLTLNGETCGAALRVVTTKGERVNFPLYHGWFKGWHGMFLRNTVWDSNIRSAFAYHYYGTKWNTPHLVEKASLARKFALAAPQEKGLFPTVFVPGEKARWNSFSHLDYDIGQWEYSDARRPDGHEDYYHTTDASYTGTWLLRWYENVENLPEIIDYCTSYAVFLLEHQRASGAIPAWVRTGTLEPSDILKDSAETSASVHFLAELYRLTGDQRFLAAAVKAAEFIIAETLTTGKWEDYETYFSCATLWDGKRLGEKDPHTGMYPANTLCIQWAADGFYSLYQATGERRFLEAGLSALDQLCLYQQVWNASFLTVPTFGGFCSQNTDGEWSDLRTGLFALTLLNYYSVTGNPEYFERAIAAQRSCFVLLYIPENNITYNYMRRMKPALTIDEYGVMWENMAHGGDDLYWDGNWVNFHWFLAPVVAAGIIEQTYGGVYANQQYGQAFGLDGCEILNFVADPAQMRFAVKERLNRRRTVPVVFDSRSDCQITVDGAALTNMVSHSGKVRFELQLEPSETREIIIDLRQG